MSAKSYSLKLAIAAIKNLLSPDTSKQALHKNTLSQHALRTTCAGNWDTNRPSLITDSTSSASPILNAPSLTINKSFDHGHPIADRLPALKCNHCRRAILRHRAKAHVEECIAKKQEKQRRKKEAKDARDAAARRAERGGSAISDDDDDENPLKRTTTDDGTGQKRKADDTTDANGPKKKKKKDEIKAKAPRPKAPVDVEKQCGVELPQGGQCARSLTCKSHSMGAKRAVAGRTAPYDKLLAEYQRKNQAKLQKAALENQSILDDDLSPSGPIDSDQEKDNVLSALFRSRPQPLYQPRIFPLKRKYQHVRLKEMLGNALGVQSTTGLFGLTPA